MRIELEMLTQGFLHVERSAEADVLGHGIGQQVLHALKQTQEHA